MVIVSDILIVLVDIKLFRTQEKVIAECIKNQLTEDCANDQLTLKEYIDPFTGSKSK